MRRTQLACTAFAIAGVLGTTGCQTFIGLEDVNGHLPRLDGEYLIAINRLRADGVTEDEILLRGSARLTTDTRSLDLSLSVLTFADQEPFTETAITDIVFDDNGTEAEFRLTIGVPAEAVKDDPAPTQDDETLTAMVIFDAEDDYSFCARPATGTHPTIGSVLLVDAEAPLTDADATCDAADE